MSEALKIIQDPTLTYRQELVSLARLGESTDDSLRYSDAYYAAKAKGALCDLNEGVMPFRPRYICPDYDLLFRKGCEFLQLVHRQREKLRGVFRGGYRREEVSL